jgi:hypothetical protein
MIPRTSVNKIGFHISQKFSNKKGDFKIPSLVFENM